MNAGNVHFCKPQTNWNFICLYDASSALFNVNICVMTTVRQWSCYAQNHLAEVRKHSCFGLPGSVDTNPTCHLKISNTYKCWIVISPPTVVSEQWSLDWKPSHPQVMPSRPRPPPDMIISSYICHVNVGICMKCTALNESVDILFWRLAAETSTAVWV